MKKRNFHALLVKLWAYVGIALVLGTVVFLFGYIFNGITAGVGNGKFDPDAACTRGQIATFLYNHTARQGVL